MKKISFALVLWISTTVVFLFFTAGTCDLESSSGAPNGYTGSPADAGNCGACHSGSVYQQNSIISSNIPGLGYNADTSYTITITIYGPGEGEVLGFSMCAEDTYSNKTGTFVLTDPTNTMLSGNYVTHTGSGISYSYPKIWTFDWIAPSSGTGYVTFYTSVLTNGYSGEIYNAYKYYPENYSGITSINEDPELEIFPVPTDRELIMRYSGNPVIWDVINVYSMTGLKVFTSDEVIFQKQDNISFDFNFLTQGSYFIELTSPEKRVIAKFIKM